MTAGIDARVAVRAPGLLRQFNEAGVLSAADVHVAQRLGRLAREGTEVVLLGAALAVRAVRAGSVCVWPAQAAAVAFVDDESFVGVDLPWPDAGTWEAACSASSVVAVGVDGDPRRPLRWVDGRLYLDRYWRQEQLVRTEIDARLRAPTLPVDPHILAAAIDRVFADRGTDAQRLAAAVAAVSRVTVLTGGPGTGKTSTVARLLAVLTAVNDGTLRVALAAPTGRAAARLQEAVRAETAMLPDAGRARVGQPSASTLHRLLGWRPESSNRFRHDRSNRLPHDLVVVDETSMVSLTLMSRLLEAVRPDARLVLVGDPDQLTSVEVGAVLGDLVSRPVVSPELARSVRGLVPALTSRREAVGPLGNGIVRLATVHRYGGAIADLAEAIRIGDADDVVAVLRASSGGVEFHEVATVAAPGVEALRRDVVRAGVALVTAAREGHVVAAITALERHRLLVAHRRGPAGVVQWAARVEGWLAEAGYGTDGASQWYAGQPLLVTVNDRDTGLYNGDTGVVVADGRGGLVAAFGTPQLPITVPPHRLGSVHTVHAMTVHRGQGSQFERVTVVLPPPNSPLLTRELLYTAVTRARELVRVIGTEDAVRAAVERPVQRASGLRFPLT